MSRAKGRRNIRTVMPGLYRLKLSEKKPGRKPFILIALLQCVVCAHEINEDTGVCDEEHLHLRPCSEDGYCIPPKEKK